MERIALVPADATRDRLTFRQTELLDEWGAQMHFEELFECGRISEIARGECESLGLHVTEPSLHEVLDRSLLVTLILQICIVLERGQHRIGLRAEVARGACSPAPRKCSNATFPSCGDTLYPSHVLQ